MQNQIKATVIADSVNPNGVRITTMELEYPRFVHAEFMTHRVFSRNSASSRAIPVAKVIEQVRTNPAMPVHWGKNQTGMQAKEQLTGFKLKLVRGLWRLASKVACGFAYTFVKLNLHKQVANRSLEPFQLMKVVVTSTEWNNFFWLRDHADAQPEIKILAQVMKAAMEASTPVELEYDMWHLPYVRQIVGGGTQSCYDEQNNLIDIEQAIKISCSSCAQVSYRKLDTSLEKAETIYQKLVESEPVHASAFEHVAKCSNARAEDYDAIGWTHADIFGNAWSGNFRDWIQYRQTIPNNAKRG